MRVCIVIPVFNHQHAIARIVQQLQTLNIHCIMINDGSSENCSKILSQIAEQYKSTVTLINRKHNGGKGAAVIDGFTEALKQQFTHALQMDADGQHHIDDIPKFIELAQIHPDKMILGEPLFDDSVPKSRLYGRKVTNFWICINTLSRSIADGMCGFRIYPLKHVEQLIKTTNLGQRMEFDIDIVVRLYWQGVNAINLKTPVSYPIDGVSHFKMWRDNCLISKTHAQLFFGMIIRSPELLMRHCQ